MKRTTRTTEDPGIGHNAPPEDEPETTEAGVTVAAGQLRSFIERHERLLEDRKAVNEDISELYAEIKGVGFDTKAVRALVKLRAKDQAARKEEEAMLDLYKTAIGMD